MRKPLWLIVPLVTIVFWQAATTAFDIKTYLFPAPVEIFRAIRDNPRLLADNFFITFAEAFLGFVIANILSISLAALLSLKRGSEHYVLPIAIVLKTIPVIALTPLLVLWFGSNMTPKIATSALICFFPSLVSTIGGVKTINRDFIDLFKIYNSSKWSYIRHLVIPFSMPFIFASLKISSSLAVVGALVGEFVGANKGLGFLILVNYYTLNTALVFAAILLSSVMGVAFYYFIHWAETRRVKWTY